VAGCVFDQLVVVGAHGQNLKNAELVKKS